MIIEIEKSSTLLVGIYILCLSALVCAEGSTIVAEKDLNIPSFQFLRQNENWEVVGKLSQSSGSGFVSKFKYIPLNEDASTWASFGGHLRGRIESWENFGFGASVNDDDEFALGRVSIHGDFHFGNNSRIFVEAKSAFSTDRSLPGGNRTIDVDEFDIQQAFGDFSFTLSDDAEFTLRAGRQALLFGSERLVSPLPWGNTLRSWDGVTGILNFKTWTLTGFWTQFTPVQKFDFNQADSDTEFFGTFATGPSSIAEGSNLDLYFFGLRRDEATFSDQSEQEDRYTLGVRIFGAVSNSAVDYDLEAAYQFGELGEIDIRAFMIATQLGYSFSEARGKPRLHLGLDYASGDDSSGDVETFNQLFPLGHAYLGYIDAIGRQNIIDINPGVTFTANSKTTLRANAHFFWLASDLDALYNAGGGVLRAAIGENSSRVGTELDITVQHIFSSHMTLNIGHSRFFASDFIDDSGVSRNTGFTYVQTQFTF